MRMKEQASAYINANPKIVDLYRGCEVLVEQDFNLGRDSTWGVTLHRDDSRAYGEGVTSDLINPITLATARRGDPKATYDQAKRFAAALVDAMREKGWRGWNGDWEEELRLTEPEEDGTIGVFDIDLNDPDAIESIIAC
jgi:hypothetical protein